MSSNSQILFLISFSSLLILIIFINNSESKPIDIFDELLSDKFLYKMAEYFIDDSDVRDGSRSSPADACTLPQRKGNCRALIRRFRYDPIIKDCTEFNFGGCGGNANNYVSYKDCMSACKGI